MYITKLALYIRLTEDSSCSNLFKGGVGQSLHIAGSIYMGGLGACSCSEDFIKLDTRRSLLKQF